MTDLSGRPPQRNGPDRVNDPSPCDSLHAIIATALSAVRANSNNLLQDAVRLRQLASEHIADDRAPQLDDLARHIDSFLEIVDRDIAWLEVTS